MDLSAADDRDPQLVSDADPDVAKVVRPHQSVQAEDDDSGRLVGASLALALLRSIAEAAYVMDRDGRVTFINNAGLRHLGNGHQPQRVYGSYLWDLWPDAHGETLRRAIADAAEGEALVLPSVECPNVSAGHAACHISVSPVEDSLGRVAKILMLARGI